MPIAENFEQNVFINCPFDKEYILLLKPLLFLILNIGLTPRIASERLDSGEVRLEKIKELIEASKYGIHDLSRAKSKKSEEVFRMNMPFELGYDLACKDYEKYPEFRLKSLLILESEKFLTKQALSDLSFGDCKNHKNDGLTLVRCVRKWFSENGFRNLKSAQNIWDEYNFFYSALYDYLKLENFSDDDIDNLPIPEFISNIEDWIDHKENN